VRGSAAGLGRNGPVPHDWDPAGGRTRPQGCDDAADQDRADVALHHLEGDGVLGHRGVGVLDEVTELGVFVADRLVERDRLGQDTERLADAFPGVGEESADDAVQRRFHEAAGGDPDEFAAALLFLCSPQSSGINGAAVELNAREVD
jgi:hypothetical protein